MRTPGERLKYYIENEGFSLRAFAQQFDMNYTGLTQIIKNERPLGMNILMQVKAGLPNIDADWLLFGTERSGVSINENIDKIGEVSEPHLKYECIDPVKAMFLKYMDDMDVQNKLREILANGPKKS